MSKTVPVKWNDALREELAYKIYQLLLDNGVWVDVTIYFNGMALSTGFNDSGVWRYCYNGEPFVWQSADPRDSFEYVNPEHIISMSFEGPFYEVMYSMSGDLYNQFVDLLDSYGVFYELGNQWNLSLYER